MPAFVLNKGVKSQDPQPPKTPQPPNGGFKSKSLKEQRTKTIDNLQFKDLQFTSDNGRLSAYKPA
jgi:hypothetical protein